MKRNISGKSVFKSSPTVTTFSAILVNSVVINEYTIRPILVESDKIVIILQQYRRTVDNSRQFYCHLTVLQQFRQTSLILISIQYQAEASPRRKKLIPHDHS